MSIADQIADSLYQHAKEAVDYLGGPNSPQVRVACLGIEEKYKHGGNDALKYAEVHTQTGPSHVSGRGSGDVQIT